MKLVIVGLLFLVVAGAAGLYYLGQRSSEGRAPGLVNGQLAPCPPSPNCVSSENGAPEGQRVDPLPLGSWSAVPSAIEAMGGTVIRQERDYIAAEFKSAVFKFTDDVEFRLGNGSVHVRSASREGYSDMGANRKRVDALRDQLTS